MNIVKTVKRILRVATREFLATVATKAFVVGLLIMPALIAVGVAVGPRFFNPPLRILGEVAIVDPTGRVTPELRTTIDSRRVAARHREEVRAALAQAPAAVRDAVGRSGAADRALEGPMLAAIPDLRLVERPCPASPGEKDGWWPADEVRHLRRRRSIECRGPDQRSEMRHAISRAVAWMTGPIMKSARACRSAVKRE